MVSVRTCPTNLKNSEMLSTREDLKRKIESMEEKYDQQFKIVFDAIKQLLETDEKPKKIYPVKFTFAV